LLGDRTYCPACNRVVDVQFHVLDRKDGPIIVESVRCSCGHFHREVTTLNAGEPQELRMEVKNSGQLGTRVVRGEQASIQIPELGLRLDPASHPEAFVTNVEGLLARFKDAVRRARALYGDVDSREKLERLEGLLDRAARGEETFTIILKDPIGQSRLG